MPATTPFIWAGGGERLTPDQVEKRRVLENALLARGTDTSPVGHWTQGVARVADALAGSVQRGRTDAAERENADVTAAYMKDMQQYMAGGAFPSAPSSADVAPGTGAAMGMAPQVSLAPEGEQASAFAPSAPAVAPAAPSAPRPAPMASGAAAGGVPSPADGGMSPMLRALGDPYASDNVRMLARTVLDMQMRREEAARAQANADRSFGLQERALTEGRLPPGYERANGGMSFVRGGPADPSVIEAQRRATLGAQPPTTVEAYDPSSGQPQRMQWDGAGWQPLGGTRAPPQRPLPQTTVNALGEAGSSYVDMNRIAGGFDDNYGGQPLGIGEARNWAGRTFDSGATPQAEWWQDYQAKKNVTRNQLFGSALTATEKGEFEKADINPGMSPQAIRTNLARQQSAALRAARKLADTYTKMGYPEDQIEAAIGVPLRELRAAPDPTGTKDQGRPGQGSVPAQAALALRQNPALRDQFDAKYGAGAAAKILGQ